jgi:hypothetical protein
MPVQSHCKAHRTGESAQRQRRRQERRFEMETNSKLTVAADADLQTSTCFVCRKPMADNQWFCRLTQKVKEVADPPAANILLCSPACALRHFAVSKAEPTLNTKPRTKDL